MSPHAQYREGARQLFAAWAVLHNARLADLGADGGD